MRKAKFIVPGNPVGYVTTTKKSKWNKRYKYYADYKKIVQFYARSVGIKLPLVATKDRQLTIRTIAYFKNGRHPDPENVNKGIRDALFYDEHHVRGNKSAKGDDKHTGGSFTPPKYSKNPRVIVIIKDYVSKSRTKKKSAK